MLFVRHRLNTEARMQSDVGNNAVEVIEVAEIRAKAKRHPPLRSAADVRRELARVYWQVRDGLLDISNASRLGHMLGVLGRLTVSDTLEQRIMQIEAIHKCLPTSIDIKLVSGCEKKSTIEIAPLD